MSYFLAIWLCMPSFIMVVFSLSSLGAGLVFTSLFVFMLTLLSNFRRCVRVGRLYLVIIVAAIISALLAHYLIEQPFTNKQAMAGIGLLVLAFTVPTVLHYYFARSPRDVARELRRSFLGFAVIGLLGLMWPVQLGAIAGLAHPVFPFSEPSHFALAYGQIASLAILCVPKNGRTLIVVFSFMLAFGFPNTTLLAVEVLLLFVTIPFWAIISFPVVFGAVAGFLLHYAPNSLSYFSERMASDQNLSRLVYMQGWESLVSVNIETNGVGIGFQNLGQEAPGMTTVLIRALTNGVDLNREDGGFLLAKIGGEFGLLGLAIILVWLIMAVWAGIRLRRELRRQPTRERAISLIPLGSVYISIVEVLVRGAGYFSPTFLLTIYFVFPALKILTSKTANWRIGQSPQLPRIQRSA